MLDMLEEEHKSIDSKDCLDYVSGSLKKTNQQSIINQREKMQTKAKVIINEQHCLFKEQETMLNTKYGVIGWERYNVPSCGWTMEEQKNQERKLAGQKGDVIFASPVPFLLAALSWRHGENCSAEPGAWSTIDCSVFLFHNDNRVKKELSNGKMIQTVSSTGWVIVTPWGMVTD